MRETFLKLHTVFGMNESLKLHVVFARYNEYFELTGHTLFHQTQDDLTMSFMNTEEPHMGTGMKLQRNQNKSLDIA